MEAETTAALPPAPWVSAAITVAAGYIGFSKNSLSFKSRDCLSAFTISFLYRLSLGWKNIPLTGFMMFCFTPSGQK